MLTAENVALLDTVATDVFDFEIRPESLRAFLNDDRHVLFLAVCNDEVVGMASGVEYFHPDKPPQFWINEVGVGRDHRRQGIGRCLVRALIDYATEHGCAYAWLGTDESNVAGQACFGSVRDGEAPERFLLYEWELQPRE